MLFLFPLFIYGRHLHHHAASSPSLLPFFLLFHLLPAMSHRQPVLSVDSSLSYNANTTSWRSFTRFIDLGKGSQVTGVSDLKKYFHRFGYLPSPVNFSDVFDSTLEYAVLNYQKNLGLPETGKLDFDTIHLIMSPRCGVGDSHTRATVTTSPLLRDNQRYAYFYGRPRWVRPPPVTLTYAFSKHGMIDYISRAEIKAVFSRAFSRWAEVIPVNFKEAGDDQTTDIKIGFYSGDHGDGQPFDGVLGVLAHAFSPENGRLHLDKAETWAVDFRTQKSKVAVDLESVVTHEIGHVLGLAHSSVRDSIMYPSLSPRSKKVELRIDDVEGIQALYGSNPDFKFSSLLESEVISPNGWVGGGGKFGPFWCFGWAVLLGLGQLIFVL